MKRLAILAVTSVFFSACSTYKNQKDMGDDAAFTRLQKTAVIFRIANDGKVSREDYERSMTVWLQGFSTRSPVQLTKTGISAIDGFAGKTDRFYQESNESEYLKFKTQGYITYTIGLHRDELKNFMSTGGYDSLIIYEVDGGYYPNMGFISFNTVITLIDSNLMIRYQDHNKTSFEIDSSDPDTAHINYLDRVTGRFLDLMGKLGLLTRHKV